MGIIYGRSEEGESAEGRWSVLTQGQIGNKSEVKRWNSKCLCLDQWRRRVEPRAKKSFYSPLAWGARSHLCGVRNHTEEREDQSDWRNFGAKVHISLRNWGACVDTIFLACVDLLDKRPIENGPMLDRRRRESILGFRAKGSVAADGAMEGDGEFTSASYLLGFVSFN